MYCLALGAAPHPSVDRSKPTLGSFVRRVYSRSCCCTNRDFSGTYSSRGAVLSRREGPITSRLSNIVNYRAVPVSPISRWVIDADTHALSSGFLLPLLFSHARAHRYSGILIEDVQFSRERDAKWISMDFFFARICGICLIPDWLERDFSRVYLCGRFFQNFSFNFIIRYRRSGYFFYGEGLKFLI